MSTILIGALLMVSLNPGFQGKKSLSNDDFPSSSSTPSSSPTTSSNSSSINNSPTKPDEVIIENVPEKIGDQNYIRTGRFVSDIFNLAIYRSATNGANDYLLVARQDKFKIKTSFSGDRQKFNQIVTLLNRQLTATINDEPTKLPGKNEGDFLRVTVTPYQLGMFFVDKGETLKLIMDKKSIMALQQMITETIKN